MRSVLVGSEIVFLKDSVEKLSSKCPCLKKRWIQFYSCMWPLLDSGPTETLPLLEQIFQNLEQQQIPLQVNVCSKVWTRNMAEMQYFFLHLIELFWFWIWAFFPDFKCRMLLLVAVHVYVCSRSEKVRDDKWLLLKESVPGFWLGGSSCNSIVICMHLTDREDCKAERCWIEFHLLQTNDRCPDFNPEWHMRHSGLMANGIPRGQSKPDSIGTRDCTNQAMGCEVHKRC